MIEWQCGFPDGELATLLDHANNATGEHRSYALEMLADAPTVHRDSLFYWRAYQELGSDRPSAFEGMTQIPYSSIVLYADEYDLRGSEREDFKRIMREVDNREVRLVNEKRRKANEKGRANK